MNVAIYKDKSFTENVVCQRSDIAVYVLVMFFVLGGQAMQGLYTRCRFLVKVYWCIPSFPAKRGVVANMKDVLEVVISSHGY
jgi:hypothetical protein